MKRLLITTLFLLFLTAAFAQANTSVDSIDFCHKKYKVPENCTAKSPYEITDGSYNMIWIYMNDQMMRTVPEQTINSMQSQFESFEKKPVLLQILGQEVKSYYIKFIADNKTRHEIISYGMINKIPVLIQITSSAAVNRNTDLPQFLRQFITITE